MRHTFAWVLLLGACGGGHPQAQVDAAAVAADAATLSDAAAEATALATGEAPWVEMVRSERWAAAAAALDALPEAERAQPERKLVRAFVALRKPSATDDELRAALSLLDGLDAALPALAPEIARARARTQGLVGPFADGGTWLEQHATSPDDQLAAAGAFERAKLPARANAACARAITSEHHTRAQEMSARQIRLHTGEPAEVIADARWLLIHGAPGTDAEVVLSKEDPKHPLTQEELLDRAEALADAGLLDDALRVIEHAHTAQGKATMTDLRRARADAMMRARSRYEQAATTFRVCAGDVTNKRAAGDLLLSARALSRADHDDEAIERFAEVGTRFAHSPEANEALFFAGRLELLHGRWDKAIEKLDEYAKHPGAERDEAERARAIAHYEQALDPKADAATVKGARATLERRAGSEGTPQARARMANLAAVLALKDGDRTHAVARFTDTAQSLPLTWAALVARARLAQLGATLPAAMPAGTTPATTPLDVKLPEAVVTLHRLGLDSAAEEALAARTAEVTSAVPTRSVEALCTAYAMVDRGRRRMQLATQAPASFLQSAPTDASRWAWECTFPSPYTMAVQDAEIRETLPTGLLYAVARQESGFDEMAVSPARALGLMQLMPETGEAVARELGWTFDRAELVRSPTRAIALGAHHLHDLLVKTHGAIPLAVASYNAGAEAVLRWAERMHAMEIDAFVEAIPYLETRGYVLRVMESLARYGFLAHGDAGLPKLDLALP